MSSVGDYEARLKALLFKANFREKIDEIREVRSFIFCTSMYALFQRYLSSRAW